MWQTILGGLKAIPLTGWAAVALGAGLWWQIDAKLGRERALGRAEAQLALVRDSLGAQQQRADSLTTVAATARARVDTVIERVEVLAPRVRRTTPQLAQRVAAGLPDTAVAALAALDTMQQHAQQLAEECDALALRCRSALDAAVAASRAREAALRLEIDSLTLAFTTVPRPRPVRHRLEGGVLGAAVGIFLWELVR